MKRAEDIIIRPYITEKSNAEVAEGKYAFVVDAKATKTEIKNAAEELFNVKVLKVNTVNHSGKVKRMGRLQGKSRGWQKAIMGKTPAWKKAIIKIDTDPKPAAYLTKGGKEVADTKKYKTSIEEYGIS